MDTLQYYTAHDDYCFVCLHSSSETSLLPHPANITEFFTGLVMNILTPWLCCKCADVLRTYQELRGRTQRAQALLSTVLLNPQDIEANTDYFIAELNVIKYNAPKPQIANVTPNENASKQNEESIKNELDIEYDNTFSEIISNEIEVKTTSAPVVGLNGVKFENDSTSSEIQSVACSTNNPTQGNDHSNTDGAALPPLVKITRIKKKPALTPNIRSVQKGPLIYLKHPQRINTTSCITPAACTSNNVAQVVKNPNIIYFQVPVLKTTQGLSSKLRKVQAYRSDTPPPIKETFSDVTFDENEDMYTRLNNFLHKKIISTRITEEEYKAWVSKTLKSQEYTGSDKSKCDLCAMIIQRKTHFVQHLKRHNQVTDHSCHLCFQYLETREMLQNHISQHLNQYVCVKCGEMCRERTAVISHYFTRHTQIKFHCKKCSDLVFEDPMLLKKHIEIWHKSQECPVCHKIVARKMIKSHAAAHKMSLLKEVFCKVCDLKLRDNVSLRHHMEKVHSDSIKKEKCVTCKRFIKQSSMSKHMEKHRALAKPTGEPSEGDAIVCTVCNQTVKSDRTLQKHAQRHALKAKEWQCHDCGNIFTTKSYMRRHILRIHLRLRQFKCSQCSQRYVTAHDLTKHIRKIHWNMPTPRNKICDVCGRGFLTLKSLECHQLIHTGEKPHSCEQCGRAFRQTTALSTHIKLVHMGMKYKDLLASRKKQKQARLKNVL